MNRLTDKRTAEALRSNIAGLRAAGIEPSVLDVMYVKLADYEDADERREQTVVRRNRMKKIHRIFENFIEPYGLCRERDIKPIPSIDTPWLRKKLNKRKRGGKRK